METKKILESRQDTHGDYATKSEFIQELKRMFSGTFAWNLMTPSEQESLDNIAQKIGRICFGNPHFKDHWDDIAGYAVLVADQCDTVESTDDLGASIEVSPDFFKDNERDDEVEDKEVFGFKIVEDEDVDRVYPHCGVAFDYQRDVHHPKPREGDRRWERVKTKDPLANAIWDMFGLELFGKSGFKTGGYVPKTEFRPPRRQGRKLSVEEMKQHFYEKMAEETKRMNEAVGMRCPDCNGKGSELLRVGGEPLTMTCVTCEGKGYIHTPLKEDKEDEVKKASEESREKASKEAIETLVSLIFGRTEIGKNIIVFVDGQGYELSKSSDNNSEGSPERD